MKIIFLTCICYLLFQGNSFAQKAIEKGGIVAFDETWNDDTIKITSNVIVTNGVTLTIESGTIIQFQDNYSINVDGRLLALGTPGNSIMFCSTDTLLTETSGGWHGIRFEGTNTANDTSKLIYCNFQFGNVFGVNWFDQQGSVIAIKDFGKLLVKNCSFTKNKAIGTNSILYIRNGDPVIIGNLFAENKGTAIELSNLANPLILNNTIDFNTIYHV